MDNVVSGQLPAGKITPQLGLVWVSLRVDGQFSSGEIIPEPDNVYHEKRLRLKSDKKESVIYCLSFHSYHWSECIKIKSM